MTFRPTLILTSSSCLILLSSSLCQGWSSHPSPRIFSPRERIASPKSFACSKNNLRTSRWFPLQCHHQEDDSTTTRCEDNLLHSLDKAMRKQIIIPGLILLASFALFISNPQEAIASTSDMAVGQKYWTIMSSYSKEDRIRANEALLDYVVGTIDTQYYDNSGGYRFTPTDFYLHWRSFRRIALSGSESADTYRPKLLQVSTANGQRAALTPATVPKGVSLDSREGAVQGLRWLVSTLNDPFSKYLTRDELKDELSVSRDHGFLGTGAIVEVPVEDSIAQQRVSSLESTNPLLARATQGWRFVNARTNQFQASKKNLSTAKVSNLPVITAIEPDSPAERVGLVVGDRIASVANKSFLGRTKLDVRRVLTATTNKYNTQQLTALDSTASIESSLGVADLTVAKPVYAFPDSSMREMVVGYRQSHVRVPTSPMDQNPTFEGGDNLVHYQLLSSSSGSIFDHKEANLSSGGGFKVGYVRLTRFSKASTAAYLAAIDNLEAAGAQSYIFDLRNNYGGKFQDALLLASSLIRDPHAILCKFLSLHFYQQHEIAFNSQLTNYCCHFAYC